MDLISQIQSFVRTLSSSLAHTVEYFLQAPSVTVNYQQFDEAPLRDRAANLFKLFAQSEDDSFSFFWKRFGELHISVAT